MKNIEELINLYQNSENKDIYFNIILSKYKKTIDLKINKFSKAYKYLDEKDIKQFILVSLFECCESFSAERNTKFNTYFDFVCVNKIRDYAAKESCYNRKKTKACNRDKTDDAIKKWQTEENNIDHKHDLSLAIKRLTKKENDLLKCFYVDKLSVEQISQKNNKQKSNIYSNKRKIEKKLKRLMEN